MHLTNSTQTQLLCQYVFNLARYDENYDIRDRARFLKPFIFSTKEKSILAKNARRIFLAKKPAPQLESKYLGCEQFQLGSLSHYLNARANGYQDLPPFPEVAPDSNARQIHEPTKSSSPDYSTQKLCYEENNTEKLSKKLKKNMKSFYTDSDNSESGENVSENVSDQSDEESSNNDMESSDSSESDEEWSESSDGDTTDSYSDSQSQSSSDELQNQSPQKLKSNLDLLLELDDIAPAGPIMTPSLGGFLTGIINSGHVAQEPTRYELTGPSLTPNTQYELLNKINGLGLQIHYRFTRAPHLFSTRMVSIELTFKNESLKDIDSIRISNKSSLSAGVQINDFNPIEKLFPGQLTQATLGIDFNDSTTAVCFEISSSRGSFQVSLHAPIGELIRAISLTEKNFLDEQSSLCGMNEHSTKVVIDATIFSKIESRILQIANLATIRSINSNELRFAGQTKASESLVLVSFQLHEKDNEVCVTVNCEKMVVGSMLLNEIKNALLDFSKSQKMCQNSK